ncbi:hypothetical protein [Streptomyces sp. DHE17-7]|uniref:hypothetical protein n=1 Tax=Streptomyces sp. DHE17-7 TaxID=2759949 RepID=UPI0022EB54B3|nr:hypothetical protein [Streptomyces sp. DHE17-7]MBJ6623408.1 hypothetical protein [Streptomyces sp. DHE17-7]
MPLSVDTITEMARAGSLRLQADQFADPVVSGVLTTYLGSELKFLESLEPEPTAESVTVRGRCAVPGLGLEPCPAVVEFLRADAQDGTVTGFVLTVDAPQWRLPQPFPTHDLSPLRELGAQSPVVVLHAVPATRGETGQDRPPAVSGARWERSDITEPVLFLASMRDGVLTASAGFPDGLALPALEHLGHLPGCTGAEALSERFPAEWRNCLVSVRPTLREVTVSCSSDGKQVSGELEIDLAPRWPLPEGVTLGAVRARIAVDPTARKEAKKAEETEETAEAEKTEETEEIGKAEENEEAEETEEAEESEEKKDWLSVTLTGNLTAYSLSSAVTVVLPSMTAKGVLAHDSGFFEHMASDLRKGTHGELSFQYDLQKGTYDITGKLSAAQKIAGVQVTNVTVKAVGDGDRKRELILEGRLTVGETEIKATAKRSQKAESWTLTAEAESIAFRDISAWAEQTMGSGLPASLTELTLQKLSFTVVSTAEERTFDAKATAEFPLTADLRTTVELAELKITTKGKTSEVSANGSFAIGHVDAESPLMKFELVADKDPKSTSWTATSTLETGMTLSQALAPLLPANAQPTAGLPDLLPPLKKLSLRYTAPKATDRTAPETAEAAASLVLTAETPQEARAVLVVTG